MRADHAELAPFGQRGPIRQHELDMVAAHAGEERFRARQRMTWRRHRDQRHRPDDHIIDPRHLGRERAADADHGLAVQHKRSHRPQRLDMEIERDGRKLLVESAQRLAEPFRGKHHVDREVDLRLEALEQAFDFGAQPIHALADRAGLGEHRLPRDGEPRLARALPLEQQQPKLRLEIGDAVADHRGGAVEPPPGGREAARLDHGQEDPELVEGRRARF